MADQFNANDPIFSNFTNIPGFDLEAQVALINKSQLLIDLLDRFKNNDEHEGEENGTLTYNAAENVNGYNIDRDEPSIQFHDIGGNDFVRILSHELGHAYDQLVKQTLTGDDENKPDGFEKIISYEMDESEATATSYIIRQQILANGGPDIKISNKLGIYILEY